MSAQGAFPLAGVVFDVGGSLWGTASSGGFNNDGGFFELSPGSNGSWTIQRFDIFDGYTGALPAIGLILDASGNLYGTTEEGGPLERAAVEQCGISGRAPTGPQIT